MSRPTRFLVVIAAAYTAGFPALASAEPITFGVRADSHVFIFTQGAGDLASDIVEVDETWDTDDLALITASLAGDGASAGYTGSASARVVDGVIGAYATATGVGAQSRVSSSGGAGVIDYFTVALPPGGFVPMRFTLAPTYTLQGTGCGRVNAGVQIGIGVPWGDSLFYTESTCEPDLLVASKVMMVPTGIPFRVLYELNAAAVVDFGQSQSATVDALSSLRLFAVAQDAFGFTTASGAGYQPVPAAAPEPASLLMLGGGLGAACARYRRRRRV